MRTQSILLLCLAFCVGCQGKSNTADTMANTHSPSSDSVRDSAIDRALAKIRIGTTDSELVELVAPHSLDSGTVYWGGTGARRIYFQVAVDKQIWFELSGPIDGNRVTGIGPVERKTVWNRHDGDSITVE